MKQKDLMLSGELYIASDKELNSIRNKALRLCHEYNSLLEYESDKRRIILDDLLGEVGDNCNINNSFKCDYGTNIHIGDNFFANFDCIILDVASVKIGNNVMFAPRVCLYTATHPIDYQVRNEQLEYGLPIVIEDNVWIGGNAIVNPGVTIGKNTVIGSGAVVTKDIPANVIAAGNPCRVIRKITDEDRKYWNQKKEIHYELLNQ